MARSYLIQGRVRLAPEIVDILGIFHLSGISINMLPIKGDYAKTEKCVFFKTTISFLAEYP
jgi:hypothetical protein